MTGQNKILVYHRIWVTLDLFVITVTVKTLKLVKTTFGFTDEENNVFSKHVVNVILNSQADGSSETTWKRICFCLNCSPNRANYKLLCVLRGVITWIIIINDKAKVISDLPGFFVPPTWQAFQLSWAVGEARAFSGSLLTRWAEARGWWTW